MKRKSILALAALLAALWTTPAAAQPRPPRPPGPPPGPPGGPPLAGPVLAVVAGGAAGGAANAQDDAVALAAGQLYELVGVLVHSGTADSGHYYSYIKERRCASAGGGSGWLHFNDTLVEPFDERDIPKASLTPWDPW